jgi:ABC-type microcin C transport system duplicated ATPase subunit YejF
VLRPDILVCDFQPVSNAADVNVVQAQVLDRSGSDLCSDPSDSAISLSPTIFGVVRHMSDDVLVMRDASRGSNRPDGSRPERHSMSNNAA